MKIQVGKFGVSNLFIESKAKLAGTKVAVKSKNRLAGTKLFLIQKVHGTVTPVTGPSLDFSVDSNSQYVPVLML